MSEQGASGRGYSVVISIGLICATIAAYWPVMNCSFVNIDDLGYVLKNRDVLNGLSWSGFQYAWTKPVGGNWHPITILSYELDASLWGENPLGYHITNLVFHCFNVLLLFFVLHQLTQDLFPSAVVAGLFAVHPMHVESVAWISERKDVLCMFFLLLTLGAYVRYASRPAWTRYLLVMVLFSLGLLAKPMLVTLPVLLMFLDYWPLNRIESRLMTAGDGRFPRVPLRTLLFEKMPLLVLALIDGLIAVITQHKETTTSALQGLTLDVRIAHAFYAFGWYLQKTFVPIGLIAFYPHPERTLSWLSVGISIFVISGISALALWQWRKKPHLIVGWAWFVISLLPVIGLLQVGVQSFADRYVYIPHFGLLTAIVWEANAWFARSLVGRRVGGIVLAFALVACGLLTHRQVGYWEDCETLWTHALDVQPNNGFAHIMLGDYLRAKGEFERAADHLERGITLKQSERGFHLKQMSADAYCNWGLCLVALDRSEEAEEKFRASLKTDKYQENALIELSRLLQKQNRRGEAAEIAAQYEKAIFRRTGKNPNDYNLEVSLGLKEIQQRNIKQAAVHFEKAVQLAPWSPAAHNNLATAQLELKLIKEAKASYSKALELNPELAGAHFNLATILESEREFVGAKKHYAEALRIDPSDNEAKQNLERLSNQ